MKTPDTKTDTSGGKTVITPPAPEVDLPIDAPMEKDPETGAPRINGGNQAPLESPPTDKPTST